LGGAVVSVSIASGRRFEPIGSEARWRNPLLEVPAITGSSLIGGSEGRVALAREKSCLVDEGMIGGTASGER